MMIGQILLKKRRVAEAIAHLEQARRMEPKQPLLLYNLSIALVQQQEYERAWKVLQELEGIDPNFSDPYDLKTKLARVLNRQ